MRNPWDQPVRRLAVGWRWAGVPCPPGCDDNVRRVVEPSQVDTEGEVLGVQHQRGARRGARAERLEQLRQEGVGGCCVGVAKEEHGLLLLPTYLGDAFSWHIYTHTWTYLCFSTYLVIKKGRKSLGCGSARHSPAPHQACITSKPTRTLNNFRSGVGCANTCENLLK